MHYIWDIRNSMYRMKWQAPNQTVNTRTSFEFAVLNGDTEW